MSRGVFFVLLSINIHKSSQWFVLKILFPFPSFFILLFTKSFFCCIIRIIKKTVEGRIEMADWEKIRKNVGSATKKAAKKTGELMDDASMRLKLKSLETKRNKQYEQLGRLTYRQLKTEECLTEEIAKVIETLDDVREKLKAQTELIEKTRKARTEKKAEEAQENDEANAEE
jgi:flagellar biosynthesis component FlhA